jgi:hypothetical protein
MIDEFAFLATTKPRPSADQPGTIGEQFRAILCSLRLGEQRETTAAKQWNAARRLTIPHAKGEVTK